MITEGAISRHVLVAAVLAASVTVACSDSAGEAGLAPTISLDSTITTSSPPTMTTSTPTTTASEPPTSTRSSAATSSTGTPSS